MTLRHRPAPAAARCSAVWHSSCPATRDNSIATGARRWQPPMRSGYALDLSRFNHVLSVNRAAMTLEVEGSATYEQIVSKTLETSLLPTVSPELKHITIGGAIVGIGIESSCFKYGFDWYICGQPRWTCVRHIRPTHLLQGASRLIGALAKDRGLHFPIRPGLVLERARGRFVWIFSAGGAAWTSLLEILQPLCTVEDRSAPRCRTDGLGARTAGDSGLAGRMASVRIVYQARDGYPPARRSALCCRSHSTAHPGAVGRLRHERRPLLARWQAADRPGSRARPSRSVPRVVTISISSVRCAADESDQTDEGTR